LNQYLGVEGDAKSILTAATDISNTGSRAGEELVQLYIRLEGTSTAQPVRALKGFERIALAPGETKRVIFNLTPDAFAIWNDRNQFAVEPANVTVWISPDSASGSDAKLKILP
jgi:beta-glucosidase